MKFRGSVSVICVLLLEGCSPLPQLTSEQELPVHVLTEKINCEMRDAVRTQLARSDRQWMKDWQGVYTVTLKTTETGNLAATTNTFPINLNKEGSKLNLGVGAGFKQTATRTGLYNFSLNFSDVAKGPLCEAYAVSGAYPLIQGNIGFAEWLDRAVEAALANSSTTAVSARPDKLTSIGHTFEFAIDLTGAISPSFVLMPAPISLNPVGSLERLDDNTVQVVFAKPASVPGQTTRVDHVLTDDQKKQLADNDTRIKKLDDDVAALKKELADNEQKMNHAKQDLDSSKATLQLFDRSHPAARVESIGPRTGDKSAEALQFESLSLAVTRAENALAVAEQDVKKNGEQIAEKNTLSQQIQTDNRITRLSPQGTKVTSQRAPTGGAFTPADQNPNISQTQIQLLLQQHPLN